MIENKKTTEQVRDYRERFEFRLTIGDNIICQRYFKINNFNPRSLKSYELVDTIRGCAAVIDEDLKSKALTYLEIYAPRVFETEEEMYDYFASEKHQSEMGLGHGIVIRNSDKNFAWGNNKPVQCSNFDEGEFTANLTDDDRVDYKFMFLVDGKEVCSTIWEGVYPKDIRNSIDLSNRKGKHEGEDISRLSFDQYLAYKIVEGRSDLVWGLIKEICYTCSVQDNSWYTTSEAYGDATYSNIQDWSLWIDKYGNKVTSKKK